MRRSSNLCYMFEIQILPYSYHISSVIASGVEPSLTWGDIPSNTVSLVLTLIDTTTTPLYVHLFKYNIPISGIGGEFAYTSAKTLGYYPPSPPHGETHRYVYTLYALNTMLPHSTDVNTLYNAMRGHVITETSTSFHYY